MPSSTRVQPMSAFGLITSGARCASSSKTTALAEQIPPGPVCEDRRTASKLPEDV
jgi:hypothetical protein